MLIPMWRKLRWMRVCLCGSQSMRHDTRFWGTTKHTSVRVPLKNSTGRSDRYMYRPVLRGSFWFGRRCLDLHRQTRRPNKSFDCVREFLGERIFRLQTAFLRQTSDPTHQIMVVVPLASTNSHSQQNKAHNLLSPFHPLPTSCIPKHPNKAIPSWA